VGEHDTYVIAVNGRLLRGFGGACPELIGINQFPYAVEATVAVGPLQVQIDRETLKVVGSGHEHRTLIRRPRGADVPADTFLDPKFSPISAIWAVDVDEILVLGEARPMVVIHNPLASSALPRNFFPAQSEYVMKSHDDYYELQREDGSLARCWVILGRDC
jgi:type I restriction enzyme S subunit